VGRFGGDQHELSGSAKVIGSAAVQIALIIVDPGMSIILLQ
jgi:diacylglycerol kinase